MSALFFRRPASPGQHVSGADSHGIRSGFTGVQLAGAPCFYLQAGSRESSTRISGNILLSASCRFKRRLSMLLLQESVACCCQSGCCVIFARQRVMSPKPGCDSVGVCCLPEDPKRLFGSYAETILSLQTSPSSPRSRGMMTMLHLGKQSAAHTCVETEGHYEQHAHWTSSP